MNYKIGILTSSRADYGIYYSLIKKLKSTAHFNIEIIAFGTHLSHKHGYTIENIINDGFEVKHRINSLPVDDSAVSIASNIGENIIQFSNLWNNNKYDVVFCLGDRYEMFAAVTAGLPYNMKFAHLYGGETTFGAIDDAFRHSITHMSKLHFTSCEAYKDRVSQLTNSLDNIHNVGALSYDNLKNLELYKISEIADIFGIDFSKPTILCTLHPETVDYNNNDYNVLAFVNAVKKIDNYQILITMPNTDTSNQIIRDSFVKLASEKQNVILKENLGTKGYLSCMKFCEFMLGNSSSGFVEASYFPTKVINLGNRQKGRYITDNIINSPFETETILQKIEEIKNLKPSQNKIYGNGDASTKIIQHLENFLQQN